MSNREKRQHYVPQGYLRRFKSDNSNSSVSRIWVYDKNLDKKFNVPIQTVASRDSFYDSFIDNYIEKHPERGVENLLREEEEKFYKALDKIDTAIQNDTTIDDDTKAQLSFYLYLQFIRTSKFREGLKPGVEEELPDRVTPENYGQVAQIFGMAYNEMIVEFIRTCISKTWIIYKMPGALKAFTSDNPVIFSFDSTDKTIDQILTSDRVFSIEGMKIIFPLDPKHVLFLYDKGLKPELDKVDGRTVEFDTAESASLWLGLSLNSDRQVYSDEDTPLFEMIKTLSDFGKNMENVLAPIKQMFSEVRSLNSTKNTKGFNSYSSYLDRGVNHYSSHTKLRQAKQAYKLLIEAITPKED